MCTADVRAGLRDLGKSIDFTNPNSDVRLAFVNADEAEFTDSNGKTYHGAEAVKHRYNAANAAREALEQERDTLQKKTAYQTRFDTISADATAIRRRYAQTLGYSPFMLR